MVVVTYTLHDGRKFNLMDASEALAFYREYPAFVSLWLEEDDRLNSERSHHPLNLLVAIGATLEKEQLDNLSLGEVKKLCNYVVTHLERLVADTKWLKLKNQSDISLLDVIRVWAKIPKPCRYMMEKTEIFALLARILATRSSLPGNEVIQRIIGGCEGALSTMVLSRAHGPTEKCLRDETYAKMESDGILIQCIRCLAIAPLPSHVLDEGIEFMVSNLMMLNAKLIRTRFKKSTPSGDILRNVIAGKDPWQQQKTYKKPQFHAKAMEQLQILAKQADMTSYSIEQGGSASVRRMCRKCEKYDVVLFQCNRCKLTFYCSKECQRADWKQHKPICAPPAPQQGGLRNAVMAFFDENKMSIVKQIFSVKETTGAEVVTLEIDFFSTDGPSPAQKKEFIVTSTEDYHLAQDPFFKVVYQDAVSRAVAGDVIIVGKHTNCTLGVFRVQLGHK
jgi:hypothetical protein